MVSKNNAGELFGESFVSMKDAHSFLMNLSKSGSLRSETLKGPSGRLFVKLLTVEN